MDEQVIIGTRSEERAAYARTLQIIGTRSEKRAVYARTLQISAAENWKVLNWQLPPKADGRRHRIVPARFGDTIDMIDLDFEIDLK
jgi:hypothetical protein